MFIHQFALAQTVALLRSGALDLQEHVRQTCTRIEQFEPHVLSLLPEAERRERLIKEAAALAAEFPDPETRPPLYGALLVLRMFSDVFSPTPAPG